MRGAKKKKPYTTLAAPRMISGHNQASGARTARAVAFGSTKALKIPANPADTLGRSSACGGRGGGVISAHPTSKTRGKDFSASSERVFIPSPDSRLPAPRLNACATPVARVSPAAVGSPPTTPEYRNVAAHGKDAPETGPRQSSR